MKTTDINRRENDKLTNNIYKNYLADNFDIDKKVLDFVEGCEEELGEWFREADEICGIAQMRVLKAFQDNHVNDTHFGWNTGYGYDDAGREAVEKVYASVFHTEAALVRPNIVNGTHAISTALFGLLKPGEQLLYVTGAPYDTLETVIGKTSGKNGRGDEDAGEFRGTLLDYGILYDEVPLNDDFDVDIEAIVKALKPETKVVALQRSTGYDWRPAISLDSIERVCSAVKEARPDIIIFADNCYGEFVDVKEPTELGVDVMAGSLIKNPGGGLALSGGYIVGPEKLIERISYRLTCPGIGAECGLTFGQNRAILQGLFLAPQVVNSAAKGAMLCSLVYSKLGFQTCPEPFTKRSDIVEAVEFRDADKMVAFCQSIQSASPIDSYVTPIPWDMPGYDDQVVMAAGNFVQGSSIELSADGPMREPYIGYFQGGLTYQHSRFGVIKSLDTLVKRGLADVTEGRSEGKTE